MFDLHSLNPEQRAAVTAHKGPIQILAGAGTGKTRTITCRVAHMIQSGIDRENILCVTFTNKAAKEMRERVAEMVPKKKGAKGPTISTFHSLCVRILRQHIHHLGYKNDFVIYSAPDQLAVIKRLLARFYTKEALDPHAILAALSKIRNQPKRYAQEEQGEFAYAHHLRPKYERALQVCNAVDFDDLILLTLRLFEESAEALDACQERFRYVMIDEYQDTNDAQFRLAEALTRKRRNLCVVGDDDQSIYSWRGAEIANLLDMERHYPELRVIKLEQNYRSTNTILNGANAVIANNSQRRPKALWSDRGQGDPIKICAFEHDKKEAETIAEEIESARFGRRITWGDQAILIRTNQQARPMETALRQARIRYKVIGGPSFFDRREIRDLVAFLNVFLNPDDDTSLLRIINTPARGISDATLKILTEAAHTRESPLFATLSHTDALDSLLPRAQKAVEAFRDSMIEWREQLETDTQLELSKWLRRFFEDIGYIEDLRKSEKDKETAENRIRNLNELLDSVEDIAPEEGALFENPMARLRQFMEEIALDQERREEKKDETASDCVTIITTHSCKGLEFPVVYVAGVEDGILPHARSKVEGSLEEERRLFYVAMTRAKVNLQLSYCMARRKHGQLTPAHPSPFLDEIPEDLTDHIAPNERRPVTQKKSQDFFAAMREAIE